MHPINPFPLTTRLEIVGTFGVTADQQDFAAELTTIKALNPDVIYFGGLTPIGIRIRSQMDKLGIKAVFDGTSGIVLARTAVVTASARSLPVATYSSVGKLLNIICTCPPMRSAKAGPPPR